MTRKHVLAISGVTLILVGALLALLDNGASEGRSFEARPPEGRGLVDAEVVETAQALVVRLGSDDNAADALILAMDAGYSGAQILAAADAETLGADGSVEDQSPVGQPLGVIAADGDGEGATGVLAGEVMPVVYLQAERLPIDRMRTNARHASALTEPANETEVGRSGTETIIYLLKQGFTTDSIIDILVLGADAIVLPGRIYGPERFSDVNLPQDCAMAMLVVDELYCPGGIQHSLVDEPVPATLPPVTRPPTTRPPPTQPPPVQPPTQSFGARAIFENALAQCEPLDAIDDAIQIEVIPTGQTTEFSVIVSTINSVGDDVQYTWLVDEGSGSVVPDDQFTRSAFFPCPALAG